MKILRNWLILLLILAALAGIGFLIVRANTVSLSDAAFGAVRAEDVEHLSLRARLLNVEREMDRTEAPAFFEAVFSLLESTEVIRIPFGAQGYQTSLLENFWLDFSSSASNTQIDIINRRYLRIFDAKGDGLYRILTPDSVPALADLLVAYGYLPDTSWIESD